MRAQAYVVGPVDGPGAALVDMARDLGFTGVAPYGGIAMAEQQTLVTPICFFLFAAVDDVRALRPVAEAIRFSPTRRLRFSPLIYFSESPSVEAINACVGMGFDDVITMPFTRARVKERMERQVGRNLTYYETANYFGPDRRGRGVAPAGVRNQRGGGQFRRLEIIRSLLNGINVVRDDMLAGAGL